MNIDIHINKRIFLLHFSIFIGFLAGVMSQGALALDEQRLWLPSNYEKLYLDLKKSALIVEKLERCSVVLRGTVDLDKSTADNPIFRILCRQPNGRTYNEMVEGKTGKTLTTEMILPELLTEEEIAYLAAENERKRAQALTNIKNSMWSLCDEELEESTALFRNLRVSREFIEPIVFEYSEVDDDYMVLGAQALFQIDFDAENMDAVNLEYTARCYVAEGAITSFKIRKRRDLPENS